MYSDRRSCTEDRGERLRDWQGAEGRAQLGRFFLPRFLRELHGVSIYRSRISQQSQGCGRRSRIGGKNDRNRRQGAALARPRRNRSSRLPPAQGRSGPHPTHSERLRRAEKGPILPARAPSKQGLDEKRKRGITNAPRSDKAFSQLL